MQQTFEIWINPEIERRQKEVNLKTPIELIAAQVIFHADRPVEVRLNSEVKAQARARLNRPVSQGDAVTIGDIGEIVNVELTGNDINAAHITLIRSGSDTWSISFNAQYNRDRAKAVISVAGEYIQLAQYALNNGLLRGFVDCLYSAVELAAKARLILIPNPKMLTSKRHEYVVSHFNVFGGKLGNAPESHVRLINTLSTLRGAKYKIEPFTVESLEAVRMLHVGEEMVAAIKNIL